MSQPADSLLDPQKLRLIDQLLPAGSVLDAGGAWGVHGGYSAYAARGAKRVQLVDTLDTPALRATLAAHPSIEYFRGDLNDREFMVSLPRVEHAFCFDVLFHQPVPLLLLYALTSSAERSVTLSAQTLPEEHFPHAQGAIFLPGMPPEHQAALHPDPDDPTIQIFSADREKARSHAEWHWALSPSMIAGWMHYLGWDLDAQGTEPFRGAWNWWWGRFKKAS